jgi:TP901 family phage tail tape measure protein
MKQVNYKINVTTGNSDKNIKKTEKNVKGLGKDVKDVNKSSGNLNDSFAVMPGSIGRVVQSFKALKIAMLSSGIGAIVVAAGALAGLFAAATAKGAEFAKQMSTLKAISGATSEEMNALSKSAKDLGSTTQFTAVQVGELQTEFAKLGFTTEQILDATKATLDLAASMEVDLASAAMLAGSTVSAFGLKASDTQQVVDVLALSSSSSALGFSELVESLKNVAPAAKGLDVPLERTTAMLGVLANNGIKGSRAGSGLSAALIELKKKGLTVDEAIEKVNNSTDGMMLAMKLAGSTGGKALSILASKAPDIDKLTDTLNEAEGAAAAMAEVRLDNLAGDTTKLESAWEGFLLSIEDGEGIFNSIARVFVQNWTIILGAITTANAYIGAFFAEIGDSFEPINRLKLALKEALANIELGFFKLQETIADTPIIGKVIDKENLQNNIKEVNISLSKINEEQKYWSEQAKKRQNDLTFFQRIKRRVEEAENKKLQEALAEQLEEQAEFKEELSDEDLKRAKKLAEKKLKLERKRLQNIAKLERELFLEVEKLDEAARQRKQTEQQNELDALNEKYFKLINDTRLGEEEILKLKEYLKEEELAINEKYRKIEEDNNQKAKDKQNDADKKEIDDYKNLQDKKRQMSTDALSAIGDLVTAFAGENEAAQKKAFQVNKAISIAQAIINTAGAISAAINPAVGGLGIPAGLPGAALAGITGAAQVATIAATQFQGSGSSSPSAPSSSSLGGVSESQAPAFNVVGQSGFNQVATALGQSNNTPIKTYVVSGDVTTAQALDNNIIDTATF